VQVTQRILVTGAGGFVCRHIVNALLEAGHAVVALDRAFDPALKAAWTDRVTLLEADANELPAISVDALIHGAAITASPEQAGQTPEDNFRANVDPALAVLEWAARHRVRRVIFISSAAVFRETQPGPVHESEIPSPLGMYGVAKLTMELLVETLGTLYGRDLVTVRLSNIYGPAEQPRPTRPRASLVGSMIAEALETERITVPAYEPARDWTFAPDVGRAICAILAASRLPHTLYNLASEQVATPLDIAEIIRTHLPDVQLDIIEEPPPGTLPFTRRGYLSSERLCQHTRFNNWTSLMDGLGQTIKWQRDHRLEIAR
jgi:UDP-glucose 4-epimerase